MAYGLKYCWECFLGTSAGISGHPDVYRVQQVNIIIWYLLKTRMHDVWCMYEDNDLAGNLCRGLCSSLRHRTWPDEAHSHVQKSDCKCVFWFQMWAAASAQPYPGAEGRSVRGRPAHRPRDAQHESVETDQTRHQETPGGSESFTVSHKINPIKPSQHAFPADYLLLVIWIFMNAF